MQRAGQILVPFIPPFLRVNRKTWDQIPSRQTIQQAAQSCWACCSWTRLSIFGTWSFLYLVAISIEQGLIFVILSGFLLILTNLEDIQDKDHPNYLSAYSVFNHGRRMLGSLNAEQFEVGIMFSVVGKRRDVYTHTQPYYAIE